MPETHLNPEKKIVKKDEQKGCKAKLLFDQKSDVLMNRIQVLEKENTELTRLFRTEKQFNLKIAGYLSSASHDCRSPLTSIQLSASLIERYYDRLDRKKLFGHLDKIKLAVIELTEKLNELIEI